MTAKESCLRLKCKDIRQNPLHLDLPQMQGILTCRQHAIKTLINCLSISALCLYGNFFYHTHQFQSASEAYILF